MKQKVEGKTLREKSKTVLVDSADSGKKCCLNFKKLFYIGNKNLKWKQDWTYFGVYRHRVRHFPKPKIVSVQPWKVERSMIFSSIKKSHQKK